jgi:arylformamidase
VGSKVIDLTMTIAEGMQTFPTHWHPFVEISQLGRHGIENRETRKLVLGTHTGTHIDAPRHFIQNGGTVDNIPLGLLIGQAVLLNFSHVPPRHEVTKEEIIVALGGRPCSRVVIRFDWCKYLGTMKYYADQPFLSEAAAEYLVENGCNLVALDVAMPDNPLNNKSAEKDSPNHKIFLSKGVYIVEYLVNLSEINSSEFEFVVAPLKIGGGDGAPARCLAIVEGQHEK